MIESMADRITEGLGGGVSIDDIMDLNNAIARSGLDNKTYMIPLAGDVDVIKGRLEVVKEAVSRMPMTADVRGWIGDSRTKEDILMNDVTINIDLNNDPFIAPKFRMSIRGMRRSSRIRRPCSSTRPAPNRLRFAYEGGRGQVFGFRRQRSIWRK